MLELVSTLGPYIRSHAHTYIHIYIHTVHTSGCGTTAEQTHPRLRSRSRETRVAGPGVGTCEVRLGSQLGCKQVCMRTLRQAHCIPSENENK